MIVIGGTYEEICFEPRWQETFGSGLRACRAIQSIDDSIQIAYHTFGDKNTELYLKLLETAFPQIKSNVTSIVNSFSFYYDYPLITPRISPRLDSINKADNEIAVSGEDILYYGLLEGSAKVTAERLVYDPQSPSNPKAFSETGSSAKKLAVVTNFGEAKIMAKSKDLVQIKAFFFDEEKADVLVIKMGPKGALVLNNKYDEGKLIPVYKTESVWPIGSGDVFAAIFAYHWFKDTDPVQSAQRASLATANYCSTRNFNSLETTDILKPLDIKYFPKDQIYLAGPFFTFSERWLIDQIRTSLSSMSLNVFSPWHDIGHGIASDVVLQDLKGLNDSKLVFAVLDGLDSGTLFEIGYAVSKNIPVIAYVENESEESVKMLEGTGCILEKDLTTAIYKALWILAENE